MSETSKSIAQWQTETFGVATTKLNRVLRSYDAIVVALRCAEECDLSVPRPNLSRAVRAVEEMAELIVMLAEHDADPDAVEEVADIGIVLEGITAAHGADGAEAKDAKMAINRRRQWSTAGDGHGQHVEDGQ